MIIAIIILSWLLINAILTMFTLFTSGCSIEDKWGVIVTILCIVFNVYIVTGVFLLCEKVHKAYHRRRGVVRAPLWKKIVRKFKKR